MVASSPTTTTNKPPASSKSKIPSLLAGISGGATSTVLLYPLDLIKVRLQVNEGEVQNKHTTTTPNTQESWQRQRKNRMTFVRTFRGLIKHEGIAGIYQGLTPALVGSAASWGGYFFLYDTMKSEWTTYKAQQQQQQPNQHKTTTTKVTMSPLENFGAACVSGAIMVFFTNPIWLIKTRMQLQMKSAQTALREDQKIQMKKPYKSMADAAKTIVKEEGIQGLYRGTVPALMLVSHGGVQFVAYEFLKERFHVTVENHRRNNNSVSTEYASVLERFHKSIGYLSMGAISKVIATTVTYPIQVVKARLQQRSESIELTTSGEVKIVHRKYTGVRDVITKVWQREGILGFFKGCIPNAIRVAPGAAITFVTYETVMDLLKLEES